MLGYWLLVIKPILIVQIMKHYKDIYSIIPVGVLFSISSLLIMLVEPFDELYAMISLARQSIILWLSNFWSS